MISIGRMIAIGGIIVAGLLLAAFSRPTPPGPSEIEFNVSCLCPYDTYITVYQFGLANYGSDLYIRYQLNTRDPLGVLRMPFPNAFDIMNFKKNKQAVFIILGHKRNPDGSKGALCWRREVSAFEYESIVAESVRQAPNAPVIYFPVFMSPKCCPGWVG